MNAKRPTVPPLPKPWLLVALLLIVTQLTFMGIFGSLARIAEVVEHLRASAPSSGEVSSWNEQRIAMIAEPAGIEPGTNRYQEIETDLVGMSDYLNGRWFMTLIHCAFGTLFLVLTPLLFVRRIRARRIALHRFIGRVVLICALLIGGSGLAFGVSAYAGTAEAIPALLFGSFFLFAAAQGYRAIRRRELALHREWMIRLYAAGLGISSIRLVEAVFFATTQMRPKQMLAPAFWLGWSITLLLTELGIRRSRRPRQKRDITRHATAPSSVTEVQMP